MADAPGDRSSQVGKLATAGPAGRVDVELDALDVYCSAMTHRPVVRALSLTNRSIDAPGAEMLITISAETPTERPALQPLSISLQLPAIGDTATLKTLRVAPNHAELALLDEAVLGNLVVAVEVDGRQVSVRRQPMTVLAHNQWMHRRDAYDSFAAFVLPNHPVVAAIMVRARELLLRRTGSGATEGYQAVDRAPDRIHHVVQAIYDALCEQKYDYSDPPADFEGFGQKIRTPDVIAEERCCTCLDSTVLFASCVAAAGLDAMLLLTRGHAFAGYVTRQPTRPVDTDWLDELLSRAVLDDVNGIVELVDSGVIVPVETTRFASSPPGSFESARLATEQHFKEGAAELQAMVNVAVARSLGVMAIPTRRRVGDRVEVVVTEAAPASAVPPSVVAAPPGAREGQRKEAFESPTRVKTWLNALLDLSYANPLLNLKDGRGAFRFDLSSGQLADLEDRLMSSEKGIELLPASKIPNAVLDADDVATAVAAEFTRTSRLYWPDAALITPEIEGVKAEIAKGHPELPPAAVSRLAEQAVGDGLQAQLERRVGAVRRRAREVESQVGSNNLFIAIGSLSFVEPAGPGRRAARAERSVAPLFLIPVRISGSASTSFRITADATAEVVPNYCLLEKIRQLYNLSLVDLEQPVLDDAGIDVGRMLSGIRKALSDARVGDAIVEESAHLAVLNFATFHLWKDLRDHWPEFLGSSVVRHLVETPFQTYEDPNTADPLVDPSELLLPIEADDSQLEAVRWAVSGRSFVIEGPPGTGKSQTITNLLAAAIAANKKVLFVAQKQAALSVVKKRLERVGLAPFCLDLHDKGSKPEQIRKQLRDALDFAGEDREIEWSELSARHDADEAVLAGYRQALHADNAAGYSVWSSRQNLLELGDGDSLPVDRSFIGHAGSHLPAVREALLALPQVVGAAVVPSGGAWSLADRADFEALDLAELAAAVEQLEVVRAELASWPAAAHAVVATPAGPPDFAELSTAVAALLSVGELSDNDLAAVGTAQWQHDRDGALGQLRALASDQSAVLALFDENVYRTDLTPVIAAGMEAATSGFLGRGKKTKVFTVLLQPFLRSPVDLPVEQLVGLLQRASLAQQTKAAVVEALRQVAGAHLAPTFDPLRTADATAIEARLGALSHQVAVLRSRAGTVVREAAAQGWRPDDSAAAVLARAGTLWTRMAALLDASDTSARRWLHGRSLEQAWNDAAPVWASDSPRFLGLHRWCEIVDTVRPLVAAGLTTVAADILAGRVPVEQSYEMFRRGLLRESIAERRAAGRLDQFDGLAHDRRLAAYRERDAQRRELMRTVIPRRLVQRRPFPPGTRIGEYGALERELSKTTRRLSIRKLMERYGKLLPNLTPCFLMSPDSVARFLPPDTARFDLAVFDEASQIEVAESIGVMGRADAVVIVGDSRQMPPSKFGGGPVLGGDDDVIADEPTFEDLESILSECVESNMPRVWLACHYRSRHEALITFSNHAFYEGRLTTFPAPDDGGFAPIHWHRVDGEFLRSGGGDDKRTNPVEARAIVTEITRRLDDPATSGQSIGVVTLNIQQAALVSRLLEQSGDPRISALLEDDSENGLIVRNLESVQGDERDVVLISVAFSPLITRRDDGTVTRGKLPLNFGPLNRGGGERRLNVAVTRAKSEVGVFCSFDPAEMHLADEPSRGLALLQQYLFVARDGTRGAADLSRRAPTPVDRHRSEMADALRQRGLRVRENLGLSSFRVDLALGRGAGASWPVAVLLDGPPWAKRSTVYDRDALPPSVLAMMGWRQVVRVWLPSWLDEPQRVIADIEAALQRAMVDPPLAVVAPPQPTLAADGPAATPLLPPLAAPSAAAPLPPPLAPPAPTLPGPTARVAARVSAPGRPDVPSTSLESVFAAAPTTPAGDRSILDQLGNPTAARQVRQTIAEIVAVEAPIRLERLGKIVATRYGLAAVRQSRIDDIGHLVSPKDKRNSKFGVYLWSQERRPEEWLGYRRTPSGSDRKIDQVAPEEIANAMVELARIGYSMQVDELLRHLADLFDIARMSAGQRALLTDVLSWAKGKGRLSVKDGVVSLPSRE